MSNFPEYFRDNRALPGYNFFRMPQKLMSVLEPGPLLERSFPAA